MKFRSVFDIIGPVMVGPSSSHTAGAVRMGQVARKIWEQEIEQIEIYFYRSFAETYRGHATDVAIIAGLLGFATDDPRVPDSLKIAKQQGIQVKFFTEKTIVEHPNTVRIVLTNQKAEMEITEISIGGGAIQIIALDGFPLKLSGENPALLIFHQDTYGIVALVATILTEQQINIAHMEVSRISKGCDALMVIETDQDIDLVTIEKLSREPGVNKVISLKR